MAKRLATDIGFEAVNGCLQLHGGYGYLRDHPIERVLRDVRVHQILEGTNEIMRLIVSRDTAGELNFEHRRHPVRPARRCRDRYPQPAQGAQCRHASDGAWARKLEEWASDGAVTRVVVKTAGERAFSAGGDIRALYELGRAGRQEEALEFFARNMRSILS